MRVLECIKAKELCTFESPRLAASGFEYVRINGIPTLEKGNRTDFVPGKGIRKCALINRGGK